MVPSTGVEPVTYRLGGDRSILLSYEGKRRYCPCIRDKMLRCFVIFKLKKSTIFAIESRNIDVES